MGLVYADIELINGGDLAFYRRGYISTERCQVKALVDRSAYLLAIPESIKIQLDLPKLDERVAFLADNSRISLDIVGPVEVRFENRRTTVDALVLPEGSEVLLGAIPLAGMDVLIDSQQQRLIVNPDNPDMAVTILKSYPHLEIITRLLGGKYDRINRSIEIGSVSS